MIKNIKKFKKIRLHREGTDTLVYGFIVIAAIALLLWRFIDNKVPFWCFMAVMGTVYAIVINFFRCPVRYFPQEDTAKIVVAPAGGRVVVIEAVEENEYFHDKRLMVSIFMSLFNVHANWFPVDGKVKFVHHKNGNYHKAWLPKASEENVVVIGGVKVGAGKAGAVIACVLAVGAAWRGRGVAAAHRGDVYLPLGTEVCVKMGQATTGDQTVIAKLK